MGHVADGVVDKDGIEGLVEADVAHVTDDVFTFGVEFAADVDHGRRDIAKGHLEVLLHVEGVVAASAAEFEDVVEGGGGDAVKQGGVFGGVLGVVFWRREQRPPMSKIGVEPGMIRWCFHGLEQMLEEAENALFPRHAVRNTASISKFFEVFEVPFVVANQRILVGVSRRIA